MAGSSSSPPSPAGVTGATLAGVKVSKSQNPPDHSHKVYLSGQRMGREGSVLQGRATQLRALRNQHVHLKV